MVDEARSMCRPENSITHVSCRKMIIAGYREHYSTKWGLWRPLVGGFRQTRDFRDPDGDDMLERASRSGQWTSRRRWKTRRSRLVSASPATVGSGFHCRSHGRFCPRRPAPDESALGAEVPADYAPPRSWEQFEELCADVFQSAWSDPGLVRHGRGGQTQNGVDIVARHGAIYPIGLQCKKRGMWPPRRLTAAEVDEAVEMAENFEPPLKQFYILTTAPSDAGLLKHVREISQRHESDGRFTIGLFGWDEIVRRAMLDPAVTAKHFGPSAGAAARSPLLATWFMSEGRLEMTGDDLALAVAELSQDLRDWPTGHFVIRQRESDALLSRLRNFEGRQLSRPDREFARQASRGTPDPHGRRRPRSSGGEADARRPGCFSLASVGSTNPTTALLSPSSPSSTSRSILRSYRGCQPTYA